MWMKSLLSLAFLGTLVLSCQTSSSVEAEYPYSLPIELGAVEFYGGDGIVIEEIRGTAPEFVPGEDYLLRGRYDLASENSALLLLSTTETETHGSRSTKSDQRLSVQKGSGQFELRHAMPAPGYPHLTFYRSSGSPIGGMYFGTGETVLAEKSWSYVPAN